MLEYIRSLEPTNAFLLGGMIGILFDIFVSGPISRFLKKGIRYWAESSNFGWQEFAALVVWLCMIIVSGAIGGVIGAFLYPLVKGYFGG